MCSSPGSCGAAVACITPSHDRRPAEAATNCGDLSAMHSDANCDEGGRLSDRLKHRIGDARRLVHLTIAQAAHRLNRSTAVLVEQRTQHGHVTKLRRVG